MRRASPPKPEDRRRPPGLAAWLLTLSLLPEERDNVLGDLDEAFSRGPTSSEARDRLWYWGQALSICAWFWVYRIRRRVSPPARGKASPPWSPPHKTSRRGFTMYGWLQDLRVGLRVMRRSPMVTGVTVLTMALGIGATTSIFSLVNGIHLKPLPYPEPDRLVAVWNTLPGVGQPLFAQSAALHFTYEDQGRSFEAVGLWAPGGASVSTSDGVRRLQGVWLTPGTLDALRVQPVLGRRFTAQDDVGGAPCTVMLEYGYWQGSYGGRRGVLGETLHADGETCEIIGVTPPGRFLSNLSPDLFFPLRIDRASLTAGQFRYQSLARLTDGVTMEQALEDMARLIPVHVDVFPGGLTHQQLEESQLGPILWPMKRLVLGNLGSRLWIIFGAAGLLLLIAVANVANLVLVQAEGRDREVAIRNAVGAGQERVFRQFILEGLLLATMGGLLGIVLGYGGLEVIRATNPGGLPRMNEVAVDPVVLLFATVLSSFTGIAFGLFPALRARRNNPVSSLKESGRGRNTGPGRNRTRNALVVAQIAVALVLLVGSGLIFRTFQNLNDVDPGFRNPETVLTLALQVPQAEIPDLDETIRTHLLVGERLADLPGVTSVGLTSKLPMSGGGNVNPIHVEGVTPPDGAAAPTMQYTWVGPDYFKTMEIPILAGRGLTLTDATDRAPVVVISESVARLYWRSPTEAIGKRISGGRTPGEGGWREIVGVVGDVRDAGITQDPSLITYWPVITPNFWQAIDGQPLIGPRTMRFAIRSERTGTPEFVQAAREAIASVVPSLPATSIRRMDTILTRSMAQTSFMLTMLGLAGIVAFLLGLAGVYGVVSYVVTQRTRELGVRIALGAEPAVVRRLVLRQGLLLATLGVGIGLAISFWASRLLQAFLFEVEALDPLTFGVVALSLCPTTLLASFLPARRAARIDPVRALRAE